MADEHSKPPYNQPSPMPAEHAWPMLVGKIERRPAVADEAEVHVDTNLQRADRLRQSTLRQAFSGRLVPQRETVEVAPGKATQLELLIGAEPSSAS